MKRAPATALVLILTAAAAFVAGRAFIAQRAAEPVRAAENAALAGKLSEYFSSLRGTAGDTDVFVLNGAEPGGNVLIVGGTHANEPAGFITSVLVAENVRVKKGRLFIIPRANASGLTHSDPQEGSPQTFGLETPGGTRLFRLGSRVTNSSTNGPTRRSSSRRPGRPWGHNPVLYPTELHSPCV